MNEDKLQKTLSLIDELQSGCNRCGLCSEACATFSASGLETDSPRGRILLAHAFIEGAISPDSPVLDTFDRCLGCRACESLCPHDMHYEKMRTAVQEVRSTLYDGVSKERAADYSHRVDWVYRIGSVFWRSYGRRLLKHSGSFIPQKSSVDYTRVSRAKLPRSRLVLVVGCVQDLFQQEVIESAIEIFRLLNYEVYIDKRQPCCGALFDRAASGRLATDSFLKQRNKAFRYRKRRLRSFLDWSKLPVCFLSASCGCFIKREAEGDRRPEIVDLYAFILEKAQESNVLFALKEPATVYRQRYCGRGRDDFDYLSILLNRVEGLTVRELDNPLTCCGGFCGETIWNPEEAKKMFFAKTRNLSPGDIVLTESMDCALQFLKHSEKGIICYHPVQLLARAITIKRKEAEEQRVLRKTE